MRLRNPVIALTLSSLVWLAADAFAQWDRTKPAANSALVSADFRNNWAALESAVGNVNLLADPTFLIWAAGDAAAPAHWQVTGTIARSGTGLGDTNRKVGKYAVKLTGVSGGMVWQYLLPAADYDDGFDGRTFACGAWVKASVASAAKLQFLDGTTTTNSAFHTGGGAWEWLTLVQTVNAAATFLQFGMTVGTTNVSYLSGPTCLLGSVPPANYMPAPVNVDTSEIFLAGTLTTGNDKIRWQAARPFIIKEIFAEVRTAPTGADLILGVNTWDGAAFTTMFSESGPDSRVRVAISNRRAVGVPDGVYARRSMVRSAGAATPAGSMFNFDIDQIGSAVAGADLTVQIRYLTFERPLEAFLSITSVN